MPISIFDKGASVFSARALLEAQDLAVKFSDIFVTNFSPEFHEPLESMKVYFVKSDTVESWDDATANFASTTDASVQGFEVKLEHDKIVQFTVSPTMKKHYDPAAWEAKAALNMNAIATDIWDKVAALITKSNFAKQVTVATPSAFDEDAILALRSECVKKKLRPACSTLCLNPDYYNKVIQMLKNSNTGGGDEYHTGIVRSMLGFRNIIEIPTLVEPGFVTGMNAIGIVGAPTPLDDDTPYTVNEVLSEEASALPIRHVVYTHGPNGKTTDTLRADYGVAVGDETSLIRIASSAS